VSAQLDARADADDGTGDGAGGARAGRAELAELTELRRRNRQLGMENEILKRAAAYFARENVSQSSYRLVRELADDGLDVAVACRLLEVSRSGDYDWKDRPPSLRNAGNELLLKQIEEIHADGPRSSYGSPRMHAELRMELGWHVNEKRVARLMRQAGIQGLYRRRRHGCTVRDPDADVAGDLVNRRFSATGPNML
jgi:helix-turn-helix protein